MIFRYEQSLTASEDIERCMNRLSSYRDELSRISYDCDYFAPESFVNLPDDEKIHLSVKNILGRKLNGIKLILVVGIGGSSLGARAIYDALFGAYDSLDKDRFPKIIFSETNDPEYEFYIEKTIRREIIDPEHILVIVITKSGTTKETMLNKVRITCILSEIFAPEEIKERFVFITEKGSPLWKEGMEDGISLIDIPHNIGGRFSVFSPVGIAPLFAGGIDVGNLLAGAADINRTCLFGDLKEDIAAIFASILFLQYEKGIRIHDSFFFETELESLGKWYRQLLAESIGKREDKKGNIVHAGITPTMSVGTQDLHSILELALGGPKDRITTFFLFSSKKGGEEEYKQAMEAAYEKTKSAYAKHSLSFVEIEFPLLSEYSLGEYMQFSMLGIAYLGKLLDVDPFIQPSVEAYKREL